MGERERAARACRSRIMTSRRQSAPWLACLAAGIASCGDGGGPTGIVLLSDRDRDGLPDALEQELGSDADDADSPFEGGARDLDTPDGPGPDALPDGLERHLLTLGTRAPVTAASDTDGDGVPDALEIWSGLDQLDADDPLLNGDRDLDGASGPAFDGIPDGLESYLLRRGARPPLEASTDSDADGLPDALEARSGSEPFAAGDPAYGALFDLDRDGLPDALELQLGSDPLNQNFPTFDGADDDDPAGGPDGDSLLDGLEGWLVRSGATAPVTSLSDTDADGIGDQAEVKAGRDPFDPDDPLPAGSADRDGDGLSDALEFLLAQKGGAQDSSPASDSDGDSIPDFAELASGSGPFTPGDPTLFSHFDLDADGVPDFLELVGGTDALDPDDPLAAGGADVLDASGPPSDPLSDALEALLIEHGSSPPVTTYGDADGDGVSDFVELRLVSGLLDPDSPLLRGALDVDDSSGPPGDGISDAAEHVLLGLGSPAPVTSASQGDEDAIPDWIELVTGTDPHDRRSPRANRSADVDGDGASDYLELALGSAPLSADDPLPGGGADGDQDGLSDALEELLVQGGSSAPVQPESDADGDGLYDYLEIALASRPHDGDHPVEDGGADTDERTGPSGDGLSDALEHYLVESGAARPVTTRSDSDGDAIPDYLELRLALDAFDATSPLADGAADDDGDGVSNALEFVLERLGAEPPVDARSDSDGDGAPDYLEVFAGADAFDPDDPLAGGAQDLDADGIADALELVLVALGATPPVTPRSETDGDGIPDAYEARSGTNPVDGDHPLEDGGQDVVDGSGPRDTITDALEALLIAQGALAPVTHASESDLDAAPDHLEVFAGSAPFDGTSPAADGASDADGDHLSLALELVLEALGGVPPLGLRSDTDADGAPDYFEVLAAAHPVQADDPVPDGDGQGFDADAASGPNGDGISDALELLLIRIGAPPPIRTESDADGDGLPDYFEVRVGSNALDRDSPLAGGGADQDDAGGPAGDGISDALEQTLIAGGASGPVTLASDSDGDGVPDFYEVFKGSDPFDEESAIEPGTPPRAVDLAISGIAFEGRELTGSYAYVDEQDDLEGTSTFRWLRDGLPIPDETGPTHLVLPEDVGAQLGFEVTPVSALAWPPESATGAPALATLLVPAPEFPRGSGGPGGVDAADGVSDLAVWLRSDRGVQLTARAADGWLDQSGWKRDADSFPGREPNLEDGVGPRLAPALRFDGTSSMFFDRPVEDDFTLIAAFQTTSTDGNGSWWLSPAILGGETPPPCGADFHMGVNFQKALFVVSDTTLSGSSSLSNGLPHVLTCVRTQSNGRMRVIVDGISQATATASTASLTCPTVLLIGSSTTTGGFWSGDLFELIAYRRVLSKVDRILIHHHLAARTGANVADNRYEHLASHGGDLAGLGREDESDQRSSAEGPGILQVAAPSALSDGDYLLWGTDLPGDFSLSEDVPPGLVKRLRRVWRYTLTDGGAGDGVGTLSMRFRVGGLFLSESPGDFALLLDEDGLFADARVHVLGARYDSELDAISFEGVDLSGSSFFTLAVRPL
jgi:hypothetical protein